MLPYPGQNRQTLRTGIWCRDMRDPPGRDLTGNAAQLLIPIARAFTARPGRIL